MSSQPQQAGARRSTELLIGLVLAAIAVIFIVFACVWTMVPVGSPTITVSRETTYVLGPLAKDGTVDYVAALNERYAKGVTPENNAALLILEALGPSMIPGDDLDRERVFGELGMEPLPERDDYFVSWVDFAQAEQCDAAGAGASQLSPPGWQLRRELVALAKSPWVAEDRPYVARWLERSERPLALVRSASHRTRFFVPIVPWGEGGGLFWTIPDHVFGACHAGRALACRGMLAVARGESAAAWRDALILYRLGRLVAEDPTLWGHWVAWEQDQNASRIVIEIVAAGELDAHATRSMLRQIDGLSPWADVKDKLDKMERFQGLDYACRIVREGSSRDFEAMGLSLDVRRIDADRMLRHVNDGYDRLAAALVPSTPAAQRTALAEFDAYADAVICTEPAWPNPLVGRAKFALRSPHAKCEETSVRGANFVLREVLGPLRARLDAQAPMIARHELARVALALAAFHGDRGAYPESLAELSPEYLAKVPCDPFTDFPFHYRNEAAGYVLYSVGRNARDDGGSDEEDEYGTPFPEDIVVRVP